MNYLVKLKRVSAFGRWIFISRYIQLAIFAVSLISIIFLMTYKTGFDNLKFFIQLDSRIKV